MNWEKYRNNYIVVLVCFFLLWALVVCVAASKVSAARQETEEVKEQLANTQALLTEAMEQKILVIEQKSTTSQEAETPQDNDFAQDHVSVGAAQSSKPVVQAATRQDVVPQDAEIVKPKESLPDATYLGNYLMTYYCPCHECTNKYPDNPEYGHTATGNEAIPYRTVAVDPTIIPYGTTLYIDYGDGVMRECIADDCGGDIKGHRLDLYVGDHQEALRLGVRYADVYLWRETKEAE